MDLEESRRRFRAIAIAFPSSIGNTVQALPLLNTLRRGLPEARVTVITKPSSAPVLDAHPAVDECLPFSGRLGDLPALVRGLAGRRFDLSLDLGGVAKSALASALTRARLRLGYAYAECRDLVWVLGHRPIGRVEGMSNVDRYLAFARALGVREEVREALLPVRPQEVERARALLRSRGVGASEPLAVLVLDASNWKKSWDPVRFDQVARGLAARGLRVVTVAHEPLAPFTTGGPHRVDLAGQCGLRDLMGLFRLAAVVAGSDTGPVHLAAALGRPTVAVFGPTRAERYRPYGPAVEVVRRNLDLPCVGCSRRNPCTHPMHHACMRRVDPADVLGAVRTLGAREPAWAAVAVQPAPQNSR